VDKLISMMGEFSSKYVMDRCVALFWIWIGNYRNRFDVDLLDPDPNPVAKT
jgi:hypothetical protein